MDSRRRIILALFESGRLFTVFFCFFEKENLAFAAHAFFTASTGREVCRFVRENEEGQGAKLFLFTADESPEVLESATKVGVAVVVLKSPDAGEIFNLVRKERAQKE